MKTQLKKPSKDKQVLKKHVSAIHIGAKLSLLQRKLVNALLYNAYDQLLTAKEHQISAAVLCEMIGFDSNNSAYLKASLKGLMETVVEFDVLEDDGERSWEAMVLLPYAKLKGGVCTYRYEQALAEKLYHPDVYSKINLSVLREMNSSHALVLYENCYRYVDIAHTPWWDVDVFRKLMSVDQMVSYKQFKLLNRAVIQPAIKEVKDLSNIKLELETKRKGRTVTGLRFVITPNTQLSLVGMDSEDDISSMSSYKALIDEGISKTLARAWVIEYDEAYIFEKIDLARNNYESGNIKKSKNGFIKAAIENNYYNEAAESKKKEEFNRKIKIEKEKKEQQRNDLQEVLRETEASYRMACVTLIEEALSSLSDVRKIEIADEFRRSIGSRVYSDAFKKGGWKDRLNFPQIKIFWEAQGVSFPSSDTWVCQDGSLTANILKSKIKQLEEQIG